VASKGEQRRFDEGFKAEAARLSYESGRSVAQVARNLGISERNLWRWRRVVSARGGGGSVVEDSDELKRLRRQLAEVTEERDVLKKALSVLSRRSP
jgi:transposase